MELLEARITEIGIPLYQVNETRDRADLLAEACPDRFYIDEANFGVTCLMMRGIDMSSTEFKVVNSWVARGVADPEA